MDPIYVTGHRNPDTDSIVAAIAYAALRNACGEREYQAACLGNVSDETQIVLDRFGFQPPRLITDLYTQVRDLDYDMPPVLNTGITLGRAWEHFQRYPTISAMPVANADGTLYGILSRTDIANSNMSRVDSCLLEEVPLFNVLSVLEGRILNDAGDKTDTIAGEVNIAVPQSQENLLFQQKETIVICGDQPDMMRRALEMNVSCLVVSQAEVPQELREMPTETVIISTPFNPYRAARLIFQSAPVGGICGTQEMITFHLDDRIDDVREVVLKYRHSCYPILDEKEKVVGILTRYHLLRPRKKRVVLVDHNEAAQSVPGLEEAEILEIIDHHRLADIQTTNPIFMRNEVVGSTNTIIAGMYQELGLMPSAGLAGMMASAILSDTVMFKSPTCTQRDIRMAERMARIANVSLAQLGREIFSASVENKTARELLFTDYKEFHIAGHNLGVAQVTCADSAIVMDRKKELLALMKESRKKKGFDMIALMVTDVLKEGTTLLFDGDSNTIYQAFNVTPKDNEVFLPKVMSRKKQVIPTLSILWG